MSGNGYWVRRVVSNGNVTYPYEHKIIAEDILGRPLKKNERVWWVDGNRSNLDHSNLVICDVRFSAILRMRMRAYLECNNPNLLYCNRCSKWKNPRFFFTHNRSVSGKGAYCRACTRNIIDEGIRLKQLGIQRKQKFSES